MKEQRMCAFFLKKSSGNTVSRFSRFEKYLETGIKKAARLTPGCQIPKKPNENIFKL
jgi:hypothetical protein